MQDDDPERRATAGTAGRWFDFETPLGKDALVATAMVGEEGVSRLFRFEVTAVSARQSIAPEDLLGKSVTLSLDCDAGGTNVVSDRRDEPDDGRDRDRERETSGGGGGGGEPRRYVHGLVTRFWSGRILQQGLREYRVEIAPKLWVLQRTARYKVYQAQSAKDIVLQLLKDANVEYQSKLTLTYTAREYCVQYGETDFDFMSRLMHEEGIFYTFEHAKDKHTLMLYDSKTWSSAQPKSIAYHPGNQQFSDTVNTFEYGPELTDYKWLATDYEFKTADTVVESTQTSSKPPSSVKSAWQQHVHGMGLVKSNGDDSKIETASVERTAKIGADHADGAYETGRGNASDPRFVPGLTFKVQGHADTALADRSFVLTEVRHDAIEPPIHTQPGETVRRDPYRSTFVCVPAEVPIPLPPPPQKPIARGPVTGLVVGPSGSEIHTDKHGRVRVQFYWDRIGTKDEKSSCFIRVAQAWAGKSWGAVFIPRVGMEVVVQFLDGDPDRPLVTGTVYNGTNTPPWTLPDKMTKSGILTRSTKSGAVADANEISFEDDKGKEILLIHAQRDLTREVENDEKITVDHDQITEVKNDRTTTVKEGNDTLTVKQGNQTHEVTQGNRTHTIKTGNDSLEVSTGNRTVTIKTGNHDVKVNTGNASLTCSIGKIEMTAAQSIKLTCGGSSVELTPAGITLKAPTISIKADAMLEEKAPMVTIKGDGMTTIEGGLVKIN
ncbi:type VI secretion system tip protein TssI/VgrG [Methylobacterium sp. NEAU 140]|uniref:type VI secretion system Vgr family protein n=1 Tax=Methylobacterium sp. NEAU 140 TaxID=3064945 RepID=UPI002733C7DF|nr:type VI secretion system tip protein TssI/VgrG [Methylobacterium sp. NEAU 140]MDP4025126.1 type VI secretion system tip protein TssI/VgrG [Methylobacterium sp. NEAU 140]